MPEETTVHLIGTPAYIDSFGGLVPCTVVEIRRTCEGHRIGKLGEIVVRIEKTKAGYKQGELVERVAAHTPPRCCVSTFQGKQTIRTNYRYLAIQK